MRISISEIRDYIRCPLYYKIKNVDEIPYDRSVNSYFNDRFKIALVYYYSSLIEGKKKNCSLMLNRWEKIWFSEDMEAVLDEATLKEKSNEAVGLVNAFINKFGEEPVTPIASNFLYEEIFEGKENLHVTGSIDLIKILNDRTRKSETCIVMFSMSKHALDSFMVKGDLEISVASRAFRSNFKTQEDRIIVQNVRCAEDTPTIRTASDYLRAEKVIRNICNGIKNGVFYPSPNAIVCSECPYRLFCLNEKSINMGVPNV